MRIALDIAVKTVATVIYKQTGKNYGSLLFTKGYNQQPIHELS